MNRRLRMAAPVAGRWLAAHERDRDPPLGACLIIGVAMTFLGLFLILPLIAVFAEAFGKGVGSIFAAITDPEALSAIRLTLLDGGDRRAAQPGVRTGRFVGDHAL